jgi:hypothetical protein
MKREDIKIDGSKILLTLFEKYKNESWVLSGSWIESTKNSWFFSGKWGDDFFKIYTHIFGLGSGISLDDSGQLWFLKDLGKIKRFWIYNISLKELKGICKLSTNNKIIVGYGPDGGFTMDITDSEFKFLKEFIDEFSSEINEVLKSIEKKFNEELEKQNQELMLLNHSKTNILKEFDKDGNGIIDVCDGSDDFMSLFKKHQKKIIDLDKEYIQKFVKISNYLKTKRQNIQEVFKSIKKTKNKSELENQVGILKNQIHSYELLLFHSLNMITSVVEEDLIVFYEIYESFDKLNMFTSNWENDVSQKLSNIGEGLNDLMFSIDSMERNIVSGLNELSYVSQMGFSNLNKSVTRELQSIDSSIKFNNLLTGISTYQLYKINKQTKGLIE